MLEPELEQIPELREVAPALPPEVQRRLFSRLRAEKDRLLDAGKLETFSAALRELIDEWDDDPHSLMLRTTCLLVADLIDQGWEFAIGTDRVTLKPPGLTPGPGVSPQQIKERIRRSLQAGRTRQLQEPSVRHFIRRMERVVARAEGRSSIADLIDDGRELERHLLKLRRLPREEQEQRLRRPDRSRGRGLRERLQMPDHRSQPDRYLAVFPSHLVAGIPPDPGAAAAAADPQCRAPQPAGDRHRPAGEPGDAPQNPGQLDRLDAAGLGAGHRQGRLGHQVSPRPHCCGASTRRSPRFRWDDLASAEEIARPTQRVIFRLELLAAGAAERRTRQLQEFYAENRTSRHLEVRDASEDTDWRTASEDHLYVRKRAEVLGSLLAARLAFDGRRPARRSAPRVPATGGDGRRAGGRSTPRSRNSASSVSQARWSMSASAAPCIPTTNCSAASWSRWLLHSKEVRDIYEAQYGGRISLIASQMAGPPDAPLGTPKVLTTTSLYGVGSSQYNRLKLRAAEHPGLPHDLSWRLFDGDEEDLTSGYGTVHLGSATVEALRELSAFTHGANRVNNRFGEGSSPRLRQIREGLDALGLESNHILHHATPRLFCASELEPDARDQLLGFCQSGNTIPPFAAAISAGWRRRWLLNRIQNDDVLDRVGKLGPESVHASSGRTRMGSTDCHSFKALQLSRAQKFSKLNGNTFTNFGAGNCRQGSCIDK